MYKMKFVISSCSFSIGSLGKSNSWGQVYNVHVNGAFISNTENGVRIKTWQVSLFLYAHQLNLPNLDTIFGDHSALFSSVKVKFADLRLHIPILLLVSPSYFFREVLGMSERLLSRMSGWKMCQTLSL